MQVVTQVAHKDTAKINLLETAGGHSTLQHASEPGGAINPDRSLVEASSGQHVVGGFADQAGHVALQDTAELDGYLYIRIEIFGIRIEVLIVWEDDRRLQTGTTDTGAEELFTVGVTPVITDPVNGEVTLPEQVVSVNGDQVAYVSVPLTSDQLNADNTALCDDCTFSYVAGECLSGDCELYDQDGTNANNEVVSEVSDDGWMSCFMMKAKPRLGNQTNVLPKLEDFSPCTCAHILLQSRVVSILWRMRFSMEPSLSRETVY